MNETSLTKTELLKNSDLDSIMTITEDLAGQRIDKVLGELSPNMSRSSIQQWIKSGNVLVNNKSVKQTYKLQINDIIETNIPEIQPDVIDQYAAEDISIEVVYQDDDIIVINKPAGLVVHPGAGNTSGTLMNGILFHWPDNQHLPRAGIVHRLDKDTSGLMVVAKNENARLHVIEQLSDRTLSREYLAICLGSLISGATIKRPIRRDHHDRRKMAVCKSHEGGGKEAITHYRVEERFRKHTLVRVKLETGRTHQIRVHMTSDDFPLVGDPVYGKRLVLPKGCDLSLAEMLRNFKRQALHATRLALIHPVTNQQLEWSVDLPNDMQHLVNNLREDFIKNQ